MDRDGLGLAIRTRVASSSRFEIRIGIPQLRIRSFLRPRSSSGRKRRSMSKQTRTRVCFYVTYSESKRKSCRECCFIVAPRSSALCPYEARILGDKAKSVPPLYRVFQVSPPTLSLSLSLSLLAFRKMIIARRARLRSRRSQPRIGCVYAAA